MADQDKKKSDLGSNSLAGAIGACVSTPFLVYLAAIWTGTISGPTNPRFWQDLAPLGIIVVLLVLFGIRATRRFILGMIRPLKKPVLWIRGLRITDERRRSLNLAEERNEALAEVSRRNSKPEAFTVAYTPASPVNGVDWFLLTDYSGLSGSGPMKDIRITGPKHQIAMKEHDGPTIPDKDLDDPYHFCGRVTDQGYQTGIDFRVSWKDPDNYPRWDFYHVPASDQPLKGVRTGPHEVSYGDLITSKNISDGSLTVRWASTSATMGRLVPNGPVWKVESGRTEGRVKPQFLVEDELGNAESSAKGVELLKINAIKED